MRKIILGLALFMGLVFVEALADTQGEIEELSGKCNKGEAGACFAVGVMCNEGKGVPQNYQKALKLFTLACDKGLADACSNQRVIEGRL